MITYSAEVTLEDNPTIYCKTGSMTDITTWLHGFITRTVATCHIEKESA